VKINRYVLLLASIVFVLVSTTPYDFSSLCVLPAKAQTTLPGPKPPRPKDNPPPPPPKKKGNVAPKPKRPNTDGGCQPNCGGPSGSTDTPKDQQPHK
jgi:hypothetical protein